MDCEEHFCVPRKDLVERCAELLVGNPKKGGHYFTIYAPRQTGKTWLMLQCQKEVEKRYADQFAIGSMSMQGIDLGTDDSPADFLKKLPLLFYESFQMELELSLDDFDRFKTLFLKNKGVFEKPLILFIDEFDSLPRHVIDRLVAVFRDMYLKRGSYNLHGLALLGVSAVLGTESERGSPFNIQRSLRVPNFTEEEVGDLFDQYRKESKQEIEPKVVRSVYEVTRGQPGLVGWFGELLTEKYNPGRETPIGEDLWKQVYAKACRSEWNNTVLNLVKKIRSGYRSCVVDLFGRSDVPFSIDAEWCRHLYLNGVIYKETAQTEQGDFEEICRFANPFVQLRLYNALVPDLVGDRTPILALEPLDRLADVFEKAEIDVPALLDRYKNYLKRLKAKGITPWKDQPRRADLHLSEAAGHFHLYAWLQNAVGRRRAVSPEFPTGNGRVDLHLKCGDRKAVIEIKSFTDLAALEEAKIQAAGYAKKLSMGSIALVVFAPVEDEDVLEKLSERAVVDGVNVFVAAIGWA